jgi:REP element-mobilizing transposase RayT
MGHSYCTNLVHCVFSTKDRAPLIPAEFQERLWAYLDGIAKNHHMPLLAVGGIANHVHLLVSIPQTTTVASAINRFKANSSRWMREHEKSFEWQKGYGAFSVSPSHTAAVKNYIRAQAEHHAKHSFEDEFVSLLRKCGVSYDPKYVFG